MLPYYGAKSRISPPSRAVASRFSAASTTACCVATSRAGPTVCPRGKLVTRARGVFTRRALQVGKGNRGHTSLFDCTRDQSHGLVADRHKEGSIGAGGHYVLSNGTRRSGSKGCCIGDITHETIARGCDTANNAFACKLVEPVDREDAVEIGERVDGMVVAVGNRDLALRQLGW